MSWRHQAAVRTVCLVSSWNPGLNPAAGSITFHLARDRQASHQRQSAGGRGAALTTWTG